MIMELEKIPVSCQLQGLLSDIILKKKKTGLEKRSPQLVKFTDSARTFKLKLHLAVLQFIYFH